MATFDWFNEYNQNMQGTMPDMQFGQNSPFASTPVLSNGGATAMIGSNFADSYAQPGMFDKMSQWGAANAPLLNFGASAIQGIANLYSGNKQMGLFKDQLNMQKDQWNSQYAMNRTMVNNQLADRQARRAAGNPDGNVQSVDEYMKKWGV